MARYLLRISHSRPPQHLAHLARASDPACGVAGGRDSVNEYAENGLYAQQSPLGPESNSRRLGPAALLCGLRALQSRAVFSPRPGKVRSGGLLAKAFYAV